MHLVGHLHICSMMHGTHNVKLQNYVYSTYYYREMLVTTLTTRLSVQQL